MLVIDIFNLFASNLIPIMGFSCVVAVILRITAHKRNKENQQYFNTFSSSIIKILEEQEEKHQTVSDVEVWLENLLVEVEEHLPDRSVRFKGGSEESSNEKGRRETLSDYTGGKKSVVIGVKQQVDALKSPHPPNFSEITDRILVQDPSWSTVGKVIPFSTLQRGLDLLPNLFIIGGIFGTFIGITNALPLIASIDISNISEAAPILNQFVADVAFSMHTSIAGIVFSVLMTVMTSMFPLGALRDEVFKNLENALEFMWYRIHGNKLQHGEYMLIEAIQMMTSTIVGAINNLKSDDSDENKINEKKSA